VCSNTDRGVLERGMGTMGQKSQVIPPESLWCDQSDAQADVQQILWIRGNSSDPSCARQHARCKARGETVMPSFEWNVGMQKM